jgi:hypothetical protein
MERGQRYYVNRENENDHFSWDAFIKEVKPGDTIFGRYTIISALLFLLCFLLELLKTLQHLDSVASTLA